MGYVPEPTVPRLNLDRFGLPCDYATYCWLHYGKVVEDHSPARLVFLYGPAPEGSWVAPDLGTTTSRG